MDNTRKLVNTVTIRTYSDGSVETEVKDEILYENLEFNVGKLPIELSAVLLTLYGAIKVYGDDSNLAEKYDKFSQEFSDIVAGRFKFNGSEFILSAQKVFMDYKNLSGKQTLTGVKGDIFWTQLERYCFGLRAAKFLEQETVKELYNVLHALKTGYSVKLYCGAMLTTKSVDTLFNELKGCTGEESDSVLDMSELTKEVRAILLTFYGASKDCAEDKSLAERYVTFMQRAPHDFQGRFGLTRKEYIVYADKAFKPRNKVGEDRDTSESDECVLNRIKDYCFTHANLLQGTPCKVGVELLKVLNSLKEGRSVELCYGKSFSAKELNEHFESLSTSAKGEVSETVDISDLPKEVRAILLTIWAAGKRYYPETQDWHTNYMNFVSNNISWFHKIACMSNTEYIDCITQYNSSSFVGYMADFMDGKVRGLDNALFKERVLNYLSVKTRGQLGDCWEIIGDVQRAVDRILSGEEVRFKYQGKELVSAYEVNKPKTAN